MCWACVCLAAQATTPVATGVHVSLPAAAMLAGLLLLLLATAVQSNGWGGGGNGLFVSYSLVCIGTASSGAGVGLRAGCAMPASLQVRACSHTSSSQSCYHALPFQPPSPKARRAAHLSAAALPARPAPNAAWAQPG